MSAAARLFEGEHDFTTFAASSGSDDVDGERDMLRVIYSSQIIRPSGADEIHYVVHGRSFLRYMVRKIVGTLLEVGRGRLAPGDISQIFELRDRSRSGPTVPPEGLYLVALDYPDPTDSLAFSAARRRALQT
jgi:tRNA pseudouridine38-40 synthase